MNLKLSFLACFQVISNKKLWESSMKLQASKELSLRQKIAVQSFLFSSNNQGIV
jgi:hypothetical protein